MQPSISNLPTEILVVYLQAALKVFAYWAYDLAEHWNDRHLQKVKDAVNTVREVVTPFASHADIEVQERVRYHRRPPVMNS